MSDENWTTVRMGDRFIRVRMAGPDAAPLSQRIIDMMELSAEENNAEFARLLSYNNGSTPSGESL